MNKLKQGQKDKVHQFMSATSVKETDAIRFLKNSRWQVENAINEFTGKSSQPKQPVKAKTRDPKECIFEKYEDQNNTGMIMAEGICQLCTDLDVDPSDIAMLVLSFHMKAAIMCEFSKSEFFTGLKYFKVDSVQKLRQKLPYMRSELKDEKKFKEVYEFAFGWAKEKGQKSLMLETAIGMWTLLFDENPWPLLDDWCKFLKEQHDKAISKDTWTQVLKFATTVDKELTNYDATTAWASLIDDFADYLIEKGIIDKDLVGSNIN